MSTKNAYENNVEKPNCSFTEYEQTFRIIPLEDEIAIDEHLIKIQNYINNNHGFGQAEGQKDILYIEAQQLYKNLATKFKSIDYTLFLNRKEYTYLTTLINTKLEMDVDTLYYALELVGCLEGWKSNKEKYSSDNELHSYNMNPTDVIYLDHLLSKNKVVGLTNDTYIFINILRKIIFISKYIRYVDSEIKYYQTEIQDWVATFDGVLIEGKPYGRKEIAEQRNGIPVTIEEALANEIDRRKNIEPNEEIKTDEKQNSENNGISAQEEIKPKKHKKSKNRDNDNQEEI